MMPISVMFGKAHGLITSFVQLGTTSSSTSASNGLNVVATPAVGDLIIAVAASFASANTNLTFSDNAGGTYTKARGQNKSSGLDGMAIFVRDTLITSASSTTFTLADSGGGTGGLLAIIKVVGMLNAGTSAVQQAGGQSNQTGPNTPSVTMAAAFQTINAGIGAVFNESNPAALTPRAAWTERVDTGNTKPMGLEIMIITSGETATTITWGGSSATNFCSAVVELQV